MQGIDIDELKKIYSEGFPADTEYYKNYFFSRIVNPNNILVYNENGVAVSAGYIIEKPAVIFGERTVFPYVTALSTLTEHRGKGKIGFVLRKAFEVLRERDYAFFGLHPFDYGYYKRFGLENISYACHNTIIGGKNFTVKDYTDADFGIVKRIYDEMSAEFTNKLLLTEETFALKAGEYLADGINCKLLYEKGQCFAFAFIDNGNMEFYATTDMDKLLRAECFKGLSYYDFSEKSEPYLQGRIINVKLALERYFTAYPPKAPVYWRITDEMIKENNVCICAENKNGEIIVKECDFAENTYSIGELTKKIFSACYNFFPDKY